MYEVKIYDGPGDSDGTVIHSSTVNDLKLPSGNIKKEINAIDSFDFSIYMNNPGYGQIHPFKTLVKVKNEMTGEYEFEGRVLTPGENMDNNGLHSASYTCEGELAYLHDSQQRHLEFRGTPSDLMQTIISHHNSQVEEYKRFTVGDVSVTNSTDNLYVYLSAEEDTFNTIKSKLIDKIGGELQIRKVDDVRYIDLLPRVGSDKDTPIKLSKNLISMSRDIDPTDIVTRLTPLGARIESADENATDASQARLTIESVNSGLPYIDRQDLIDVFGIQGGSVTWDDITIESNLYNAGLDYINNQKISLNQYKISAVDLFYIGLTIDRFEKGDSYMLVNPIMGIDERLRVIGLTIDINSPQNSNLTIGDKFKNLYEYESESRKSTQAVNDLQNRLERLSNANNTLNQQLIDAQAELTSIQDRLTSADVDTLPDDLQAISNQISALQTDIDNLNIPEYGLATQTEDGLMSSVDKAKLDGLESFDVATELQDGLMGAVDKVSLNKVISDLGDITTLTTTEKTDIVLAINELVTRLEVLEGGA
jgi:uncharacterized protein YkvS